MAEGHVEINGNGYVLLPFTSRGRTFTVRHYVFKQTVEIQGGLDSPETRAGVWPIKYYSPYYGMGRRRIIKGPDGKVDPRDFFRIWDSDDMMTWWAARVNLGPLINTSTDATTDERIRGAVSYKGDIWTLWEDSTTAAGGFTTFEYFP